MSGNFNNVRNRWQGGNNSYGSNWNASSDNWNGNSGWGGNYNTGSGSNSDGWGGSNGNWGSNNGWNSNNSGWGGNSGWNSRPNWFPDSYNYNEPGREGFYGRSFSGNNRRSNMGGPYSRNNDMGFRKRAAARPVKGKRFRIQDAEKNKEMQFLKDKYRSVLQNRHLSQEEQFALVFLKKIAFDLGKDHCLIDSIYFSRFTSRHWNAIKLFSYECKVQLDRKFGGDVGSASEEDKNKRLEFLNTVKREVIDGYKTVYKKKSAAENMDLKEQNLQKYVEKLASAFTDEDIPSPKDYLFNKEHKLQEEDFIDEFKYNFIRDSYQVFKFKTIENSSLTKNMANRVKFHVGNKIIPFILVETIRSKAEFTDLPAIVGKYLQVQSKIHRDKQDECHAAIDQKLSESNDLVKTPIARYIKPGEDVDAEVYRDFAECILKFDKLLNYIRYQCLNFSLHVLLPTETKDKIFFEMVDLVYSQALDILKNNEKFATFPLVDLEQEKTIDENQ